MRPNLLALTTLFATLLYLATPAQAQTATYFVATSGNDTNAGTQSAPWRTIGKAAKTAVAGSTVNVRGGVYNERVTVSVSGSATAGFTTFQSFPGETAVVDGTGLSVPSGDTGLFLIVNRSYLRLKGFEIRNFKTSTKDLVPVGINVRGSSHHIEIRNNKVHHIETNVTAVDGGDAHGIAVFGTSSTQAITNLVIDGNEVYSLKLGSSESVVLNGNVTGFEVTNNVVHDNNNIGIDFIGFEGTCSTTACDQARSGVCSGNRVYNIDSSTNPAYEGSHGADGIYVDGGRDIIIERNVVSTTDIGIEIASEHSGKSTSNVTIRNNFVYKNNITGIAMGGYDTQRGSTQNCKILNNTLFQNDTLKTGLGEIYVQFDTRNNVIKNNVIYANSQNLFIYNGYTQNTGNVVDYNVFHSASGSTAGKWRWKNVGYTGFSAYRSGTGNDAHSRFANPLLVSESSPNLHLQSGSPAIDVGDGSVALASDLDIDGQSRVMGAAVDVGADEFSSAGSVAITSPADGSSFVAPASITLQASATSDGTITQVEFSANGTLLGVDTTAPYAFTWSSVPQGSYSLTALARDNLGKTITSSAVSITVTGSTPTPTKLVVPASAVTASANDGNVPANTVDGSLSTRWSASGDGQWIRYDLGSVKTVSHLRLAMYSGNTRQAIYEIRLSTDGVNWTTVFSGNSSGTTLALETRDFTDRGARYVMYLGHGNTSNAWNSITETEIWGY